LFLLAYCNQTNHSKWDSLSLTTIFSRLLYKGEYQALQAVRKQQTTAVWKQTYNQRAGIEGTLSQGVNPFGLRRSRYLGLGKTWLQHILTSTAMNIVRSVAWLQGVPTAHTRTSRFAALAPVPDYV
jgi:transposase